MALSRQRKARETSSTRRHYHPSARLTRRLSRGKLLGVNPVHFSLRGAIADVDHTLPGDPRHPALILIVEAGQDLLHVFVPSEAWTGARELLQQGRRVRVVGDVGELGRPRPHTAHRVDLVDVQ